ncbi:MAG: hypothetical protein ACRDYD_05030 [Acidimicrobiales bacterium]
MSVSNRLIRLSGVALGMSLSLVACGSGHTSDGTLRVYAPPCPGPSGHGTGKVPISITGPGAYKKAATLHDPYQLTVVVARGTYRVSRLYVSRSVTVRGGATTNVNLYSNWG